uniref:Uncharacterized protein n=1 Tax=Sphaerodactylus townsendi TaxID=933632 RepID=A0ACB8EZN8_9SAUR
MLSVVLKSRRVVRGAETPRRLLPLRLLRLRPPSSPLQERETSSVRTANQPNLPMRQRFVLWRGRQLSLGYENFSCFEQRL